MGAMSFFCIFLVYILPSNGHIYHSEDVDFDDSDVQSILHGESIVSCLSLCENDEHCERIAFKSVENEVYGDCILLLQGNAVENISDRNQQQNASIYYKQKPPCEEITCSQNQFCVNHFGGVLTKICQCPYGFKGSACMEYTGKGSSNADPHVSCLAIREEYRNYHLQSGYYWMLFQNTSIPIFCDMTTDGGGWTQIANVSTTDVPRSTDEFTYSSPLNFRETRLVNFMLDSTGLKFFKDVINATQIRIYCHKPAIGRTLHIVTRKNISGINVLNFLAFETDVNPTACDSFITLSDDNSWLSKTCEKWNYGNLWSHKNKKKDVKTRLYDHVIFYPFTYHIIVTEFMRFCDDNDNINKTGIWKYFIR